MTTFSNCDSCPNQGCKIENNSSTNDHSYQHFSIDRYEGEIDQYKAFLVGDAPSPNQALSDTTSQDLRQWEKEWQRMAGDQASDKVSESDEKKRLK
ncbi:MAG: hypothetical protein Q9182_000832 [Xanthomendoza sp. 2 TL-2023]